MTVDELRAQLANLPGDAKVWLYAEQEMGTSMTLLARVEYGSDFQGRTGLLLQDEEHVRCYPETTL